MKTPSWRLPQGPSRRGGPSSALLQEEALASLKRPKRWTPILRGSERLQARYGFLLENPAFWILLLTVLFMAVFLLTVSSPMAVPSKIQRGLTITSAPAVKRLGSSGWRTEGTSLVFSQAFEVASSTPVERVRLRAFSPAISSPLPPREVVYRLKTSGGEVLEERGSLQASQHLLFPLQGPLPSAYDGNSDLTFEVEVPDGTSLPPEERRLLQGTLASIPLRLEVLPAS